MLAETPQKGRFGERSKFVPMVFVGFTICTLYSIFMFCHCLPELRGSKDKTREIVKVLVFHFITILLVISYVRSVLTHPGTIPDNDQWAVVMSEDRKRKLPKAGNAVASLNLQETKRSGNRRNCKWCNKYKPDRCHHCRQCQVCVLKMDHHCPWIYNCVGFYNYKYFFLLLLYTLLDLWLIATSLSSSVKRCILHPETPFAHMFLCLFGWTLSTFLGVIVTFFWCFHIWLCGKAMSTVEFCEKALPKTADGGYSYNSSVYNLGLYGNLKATLGECWLTMLLPCAPPAGDGLDFTSADMRLSKDLAASKTIRRMGHVPVQRSNKGFAAFTTGVPGADDDGLHHYGSLLDSVREGPPDLEQARLAPSPLRLALARERLAELRRGSPGPRAGEAAGLRTGAAGP